MRNILINFKVWLASKLDQLDRNSYVVCMWNGRNWQVVRQNLSNRKQALAMRNIYVLRMDLEPGNVGIFTYKTAVRFGMFQ